MGQRPLGPLTLIASVKSLSSWSPATAQSSVTSPAVMSVMRTQPGTSAIGRPPKPVCQPDDPAVGEPHHRHVPGAHREFSSFLS